jgi:hypothetical protein
VATHGWTQPHGDGIGPWVIDGMTRSVALVGGRSGGTPMMAIVAASMTTATSIGGGRGMRVPEKHSRGATKDEGHDYWPLEAAKVVVVSEAIGHGKLVEGRKKRDDPLEEGIEVIVLLIHPLKNVGDGVRSDIGSSTSQRASTMLFIFWQ